MGVKQQF